MQKRYPSIICELFIEIILSGGIAKCQLIICLEGQYVNYWGVLSYTVLF